MAAHLEVRNVSKLFGTHKALNDVSLLLYPGEVVALLGVNGAGKTTLSSLIAGIHPPTSGDILYQERSIYSDIVAYRQYVGYCPQKFHTMRMLTVYEQLWYSGQAFGLEGVALDERIAYVVERCHLQEVTQRMPEELSGGYRQRCSIARSLLHNPHIIILDEPTVALDPHIRRQLWDLVLSLKADGRIVLLTTHYIDEAEQLADKVCLMEKGTIKLVATPQEILTSSGHERLEEAFLALIVQEKRSV